MKLLNSSPLYPLRRLFSTTRSTKKRGNHIGFIGLGNMGTPMAQNLLQAGYELSMYDTVATNFSLLEQYGGKIACSPNETVYHASEVITVLPNDKVLKEIVGDGKTCGILKDMQPGTLHLSCSTISPETSRELASLHADHGCIYVASPIFARPDGMSLKQSSFVVSGEQQGVERATLLLNKTSSGVYNFGDDPGAANVVKLGGNFLIASAIESMAEATALAEKNELNREQVMQFYSSTFLNCVIYQGYGKRVSERDHRPGGFALEHGLKDMTLVKETASKTLTPMPFLSILLDRFLGEKAKGREHLDWSAIALGVSENCGVDVTHFLQQSSNVQPKNEDDLPLPKQRVGSSGCRE